MGIKSYPFILEGVNGDEWKMNAWEMNEDIIHPIHPLENEWVKVDPHLSPFPIHRPYPVTRSGVPLLILAYQETTA